MIKVNLLGDSTRRDFTGVWMLIGYGFSMAGLLLGCILNYASLSIAIEEKTHEKDNLERQEAQLSEKTKEVQQLEAKRKELAQKTSVIALLKRSKSGPVRVLDDLNKSIPERAWVLEMRENNGQLRVIGRAIDNQTISTLMLDLEKSDYYNSVELEETKRVEQQGASIKEFVIRSKVDYSGLNLKLPEPGQATPAAAPKAAAKGGREDGGE